MNHISINSSCANHFAYISVSGVLISMLLLYQWLFAWDSGLSSAVLVVDNVFSLTISVVFF